MIQPCYDGSFLSCFISFSLFFCFLIWFWIYSLRPHQVLIQGCTFLQPVVIINNRYFFLWLFFILWSLKIRSWKNMTKIIKFLFFIIFLQPINEFVDFFNNQQQIDMKNNMNQFSNTNPQTPSSIPDIILTGELNLQNLFYPSGQWPRFFWPCILTYLLRKFL